jgi:hypothetical protein
MSQRASGGVHASWYRCVYSSKSATSAPGGSSSDRLLASHFFVASVVSSA